MNEVLSSLYFVGILINLSVFQQQYLCVKSEEDDDWVLASGFSPIAKQILQSELRSIRPMMTKLQQDVLIGRLETCMHDELDWNELPKSARIDSQHFIKAM